MEAPNGDFKSKMDDYQVIDQIGKGSFGPSFLVLHKTDDKKYVLKKMRISKQSAKFKGKTHLEMNLIANLHHPYIVQCKDAWVEKESCICVVTDYCEGGNITGMIRKARGAYFPEEKVCKWLTQLLLAINYLHSNRVLHGDLKLSNIFITVENNMRLGDFGLAKLVDEESLASSVVGTANYMCPELLADLPDGYTYKSDIWSLGCCMFEIAAHHQAFKAPDMAGLINKINKSLISPLPIVYSSTLKQIIKSMLRRSPEHRPTAAELLRHPHLQPFLMRCHNPSTVFLPIKSPSPINAKEKTRKSSSPKSSSRGKYTVERESKLKQRELLPLFDDITLVQYPNLLDGNTLTEENLDTKHVDPTSFSGQVSHDRDDSKTGDTSVGTMLPSNKQKILKFENGNAKIEETVDLKPPPIAKVTEAAEIKSKDGIREKFSRMSDVCGLKAVSFLEENSTSLKSESNVVLSQSHDEAQTGNAETKIITCRDSIPVEKEGTQIMIPPSLQRADALESLLELCARLMKQDKFDELKGVLKPFGDDVVSSRETAIWLTKSLMNAQKLAEESS